VIRSIGGIAQRTVLEREGRWALLGFTQMPFRGVFVTKVSSSLGVGGGQRGGIRSTAESGHDVSSSLLWGEWWADLLFA
jgi:hypothetical protein